MLYELNTKLDFGKYGPPQDGAGVQESRTIRDILVDDPGYFIWCADYMDHFILSRETIKTVHIQFPDIPDETLANLYRKEKEYQADLILKQADLLRLQDEQSRLEQSMKAPTSDPQNPEETWWSRKEGLIMVIVSVLCMIVIIYGIVNHKIWIALIGLVPWGLYSILQISNYLRRR